jgi:hypothetical protein
MTLAQLAHHVCQLVRRMRRPPNSARNAGPPRSVAKTKAESGNCRRNSRSALIFVAAKRADARFALLDAPGRAGPADEAKSILCFFYAVFR